MSLLEEYAKVAADSLAQQENELLTAAIGLHTGDANPNPYDYIPRLARHNLSDGYVIFLDGAAILFVGKPTYVTEGLTTKFRVPYRHILPQRKPNEQLH